MSSRKAIGVASLWLAAALPAAAQGTLAGYDYSSGWSSSSETIVFAAGDAFEFVIESRASDPVSYPGANANLGYVRYLSPEGDEILIPTYVANLRNALVAAKAYFAARGMDVADLTASNRLTVTVKPIEDRANYNRTTGAWVTGTAAVTTIWGWRSMDFDLALSQDHMICTAIHEWFHLVQSKNWATFSLLGELPTGRNSVPHTMAIEGTADWASDEPIVVPLAQGGSRNADSINQYQGRFSTWSGRLNVSLWDIDPLGYASVFLWKFLGEQAGGSGGEAAAIKSYWDLLAGRNYRGKDQFMESIAGVVGGSGRRHERFRRFFTDFAVAACVQVGGPLGFQDDYFAGQTRASMQPTRVHFRMHYSRENAWDPSARGAPEELPPVEATVASGEDEIRRRLDGIALSYNDIAVWGSANVAVSPSGGTFPIGSPGPNVIHEPTKVIVQATGDSDRADAWSAVLLTQRGGQYYGDRGTGISFSRRTEFTLAPTPALGGRCSAIATLDGFARDFQHLWLVLVNTDEQAQAREIRYSYVVVPTFQASFGSAPRDTSTVHFVDSRPARAAGRPFHPGDQIRIEVDLSDSAHDSSGGAIPAERRSLEPRVLGPGRQPVRVEDEEVTCPDSSMFRYRYSFTLPPGLADFGEYRVEWTLHSRLKLGDMDRSVDDSFRFEVAVDRPEVDSVVLRRDLEVFVADPGESFRPVSPGAVTVQVSFNQDMDREKDAEVSYDGTAIEGEWKGERRWEGRFEVPDGAGLGPVRGRHTLSIMAEGANGGRLDADFDAPGEQPDTHVGFVIDAIPPFVEHVAVYAGRTGAVYDARWTREPDLYSTLTRSVTEAALQNKSRRLEIATQEDLPAAGVGTIYIDVTQPLDRPPTVRLGGVDVPMQQVGHPKAWEGNFDVAEVQRAGGGSVVAEITLTDKFGNPLDADPRTLTALRPEGDLWSGYESDRQGGTGGSPHKDTWHELGVAPSISLVILLDASGSMGEGNKMEEAKEGIRALLGSLPAGVELALVVFFDCENIQSVGFTRDVSAVRQMVDAASPNSATPLAAAIAEARDLLMTASNPRSYDWRYEIFSDGQETCEGDVIAEMMALDDACRERAGQAPARPAATPPPPPPPPAPVLEVHPDQWTTYRVRVRFGNLHLDTIWLDEIEFVENAAADGGPRVQLTITTYGVSYGELVGDRASRLWRINGQASDRRRRTVTSANGAAAVDGLRTEAQGLRAAGIDMAAARAEIGRDVNECLDRMGDHP